MNIELTDAERDLVLRALLTEAALSSPSSKRECDALWEKIAAT